MNGAWAHWKPGRLFFNFDPVRSYLGGETYELRDEAGKTLLASEEAPELLLLGYRAMRNLGQAGLPDMNTWHTQCSAVLTALRAHAKTFNWEQYTEKTFERLAPLDPQKYSQGSSEAMLLHDLVLASPKDSARTGQFWSMLCLVWIDSAIQSIDSVDAAMAVEEVLRAGDALANAGPPLSRIKARSDMARENAIAGLANNEKQLAKKAVKEMWLKLRDEPKFRGKKAPLARHIMDQFPMFQNENVLTGWFRDWEGELHR
ncbi:MULTISPECIES: hypothetical protein [Ramlibacter]|uniref:Uncharacterized protein n=1 Tax=Ramlibacter pinisoli TaxID=2682844 RepID=A0A6N8ISW9_9BURK|nr:MULTISPECIES: hypothetical protein [Ramlibacter]MBA2964989.1 hypothetical protein [Ramlibacter sp. CGMCC 1.13660]MVQ29954.1 hypothetical protein [Ramlibacter pinisoli]